MRILIFALVLTLAGCRSVPLVEAQQPTRFTTFVLNEPREVSLGETMGYLFHGHWLKTFRAVRLIAINDLQQIEAGSVWTSLYNDASTGHSLLTTSGFYGGAIALRIDSSGRLAQSSPAVQIQGAKRGRTWELHSSENGAPAFSPIEHTPDARFQDQAGWRLYYIGISDGKLRLTAEDVGARGEALGRIEYAHELRGGREFVFRGVRINIDQEFPDGRIRFTVIEDRST